jgi:hypothetical protein
MIINKDNLSVIDAGALCLHDLLIRSINFDIEMKSLNIQISDYHSDKLIIRFENVFELWFSSIKIIGGTSNNELFGWEEIPNEDNHDAFIKETKSKLLANGGHWNDSLFAVRLLLTNMSEIKVICEKISID